MDFCKNCDKELNHIEGRRKKQFCNSSCRQCYWQKINKSQKELKYKLVPIEEYERLISGGSIKVKSAKVVKTDNSTRLQVTFEEQRPERMEGESGIDYQLRLAEWKDKRK